MKRLLISVLTVTLVAGAAFGASRAFFSDTETSTGNLLEAGKLDLKVDSTAHYAGMTCINDVWVEEEAGSSERPDLVGDPCVGTWELKDLGEGDTFFNLTDVKPGDEGENTISLHVFDNDAWACATINPTFNDDMSSTEPELEAGDVADSVSVFDGELAQNTHFRIWADTCDVGGTPGDNIFQENCDVLLTEGTGPLTPTTWALADSQSNVFTGTGPLIGSNTYYLGVGWWIPDETGNIIQSDKYMADISFNAVQKRNNPTFVCPSPEVTNGGTLRLENEEEVAGGPWTVVVDQKFVDMTYNSSGNTFDYSLTGQGLAPNTEYALIYYADGWPGNNPGALIGLHTTDSAGAITTGGIVNKELNMDLPSIPDSNFAVGAKIWLIPSSAYDQLNKSVITWPPDFNTWFFEGNVYIKYDDIGV